MADAVAAEQAGDKAKVARIDTHEDECCKWKTYHRSVGETRARAPKENKRC